MMRYDFLLALFGAGVAIIGLFSLPALSAGARRLRRKDAKQEIYGDADGVATPESMKAFSSTLPKSCILLFAIAGLGLSIVLTLLMLHDAQVRLENLILIAASWVSPNRNIA